LVLQAAIVLVRNQHAFFGQDDFLNFGMYRDMGLSGAYLFQHVFGQIAPGYRATHAVYLSVFGLHYWGCILFCVLLSVVSTGLLLSIGQRLKLESWAIAAAGIVYVSLLQPTHAQLWWSAAAHTLPSVATTLAVLWCLVGPEGGGPTKRGRLMAAAWFGVGLLFTIKVMFSLVFLVALLVYVRRRGGAPWRQVPAGVLRDLLWFAPVVCVYCVVLFVGWVPPRRPTRLGTIGKFVFVSWSDGTMAATFGLGRSGLPFHTNGSVLFASLVVIALILATIRAQKRVGILWLGFLCYVIVAMSAVAFYRSGEYGWLPGAWPRYNVENATFLVLTSMASLSGLRLRRRGVALLLAVAAAIALNLQVQSTRLDHGWSPENIRRYVAEFQDYHERRRRDPTLAAKKGTVPAWVVPPWMSPHNRIEWFERLFD